MPSGSRASYLDSSAIVKLAVSEPESATLRRYLARRHAWVSSALARVEVGRALLPLGAVATRRGGEVLARIDLVRINDRVLADAATLLPAELRALDAIHVATARLLGDALARVITYDDRMAEAARGLGLSVVAPQ